MSVEVRLVLSNEQEKVIERALTNLLLSAKGKELTRVQEVLKLYKDAVSKSTSSGSYQSMGYDDRESYLKVLANEYGVSFSSVLYVSNLYGGREDFGKLVEMLESMTVEEFDDFSL